MTWWQIALIVGGVLLLFILLVAISRHKSKKNLAKLKKASIKPEPAAQPAPKVEEPKQDEYELLFNQEKKKKESVVYKERPKFEAYDPDDDLDDEDDEFDDAELDEEIRRYKERMMARSRSGRRQEARPLSEDEEFEKFRNEHCYSKYVTDRNLVQEVKGLDEDVLKIIFGSAFERKNFDDINFGS